jgi:hypothetical protein
VSRRPDLQPGGGELAAVGHPPAPGSGLEKNPVFLIKPSPVVFFWLFFGFLVFFHIFAQKRVF